MSVVGMTSFAGIAGSVGVLQAMQAELAAVAAANEGASQAITPAGSEGASVMAMSQQRASSALFATHFALGIEQMMELNGAITAGSAAHEVADAGNAVMQLI
ncbi:MULTISPECIES: hypothetical protein [Mycobacterium avium complex (MAC)]|uniref:PE family protein n=2 Tax=Mycobacterium intracellulare TaxID=1767 RepID=A0ABT7P6R4_MYCIT|nr:MULTISPECIES: hypothetical protein [Mycobacterium avium complex (MAC)]AOS94965.1 hypothetical protein AN480_28395 [Mycobacterium intracellulare subsp. chimaera]MDM3928683.1 hypothetical protein [Mycobacterium intracellulare subsp. chimaera]PBA69052.1 hypothetical protein CKJ76_24720 [Mycobacterium avium]